MKSWLAEKYEREVEILDISIHGVWISVNGMEYFLSFDDFPWFKEARISEIHRVRRHGHLLRWPDLDMSLDLETLTATENRPLAYL